MTDEIEAFEVREKASRAAEEARVKEERGLKLKRLRVIQGVIVGLIIATVGIGATVGVGAIMRDYAAKQAEQAEIEKKHLAERKAKEQEEERLKKLKQAEEERQRRIEEEKRRTEELARRSVEGQKQMAREAYAEIEARRKQEWPGRKAKLAGKKLVALTFDDGPGAATTPRLLDILKAKGVKATFFALGLKMRQHPEIVKRELVEGHEVEGHTMYHNDLGKMAGPGVRADIGEADEWFLRIVGRLPKMIRPPYGSISPILAKAVGERSLLMWSVDTLDWRYRIPAEIHKRALAGVHDGAVILMHDIHATTITAVPGIIDALRGAGYEMVTVEELAELRGVAMQGGVSYSRF